MNNTEKLIALTFDDGPAQTTLAIVEALEVNDSVATFFTNGMHLKKYPQITAKAKHIGCEIGNHTSEHKHLPELEYDEILEEITSTTELIISITDTNPTIMRPPFGEYNESVKRAARASGLALINWSIDPKDWDTNDPDTTRERILNEVKDGAVILCHDRMPGTAELMPRFIPELKQMGYKLVTVSQLFDAKGITLEPGILYLSPYDKLES